ncbi:MAG: hypothetical protein EPO11_05635, partial [Gammaproteobacteria bacterium]
MDIFQHIQADTLVLTPNRRLSAVLHKRYQAYQLAQSSHYWKTPTILPIASWLERLFYDYISEQFSRSPLLLNTIQEPFLWEKIVLTTTESDHLLQAAETAHTAKSAWGLLKQWQVDIHHPIFESTEDYLAFQRWAQQFQQLCHDQHWIDATALPDFIAAKIQAGDIIPPPHIVLIGFTELSPVLKHLFSFCHVQQMTLCDYQAECSRIKLADQEEEILTLARWAKSMLTQHHSATIGCVIPALDKKRDRVMQIFSDVFEDKSLFNLSAGKNLLHYPIINTALQLLALYKKNISSEVFSYLLASPFLGEAESERTKRANLDRLLRKKNINQVNLREHNLEEDCPQLGKRIQQFFLLMEESEKTTCYSEWAKLFNQLLSTLGWPGERSLSSEEYQMVENWLDILAEFSLLDQIAPPVHFQQALQALHKIVSNTIFQAKTPDAPVQVLGVLEAAALPFDYLWVAGMDDLSWPPQPKPNPFIPKLLQRELHMPHATAERELMFCETLTKQFQQSAQQVIFSHAEKNEELELQASPLIRNIPLIEVNHLELLPYQSPGERIYLARKTEYLLDEVAPPQLENESIRGGVSVIKQQALCPFKAFAEWRLHAHELEKTSPGLRTKDRGNIV